MRHSLQVLQNAGGEEWRTAAVLSKLSLRLLKSSILRLHLMNITLSASSLRKHLTDVSFSPETEELQCKKENSGKKAGTAFLRLILMALLSNSFSRYFLSNSGHFCFAGKLSVFPPTGDSQRTDEVAP